MTALLTLTSALSIQAQPARAQTSIKDYFPLEVGPYWSYKGVRRTRFSEEIGTFLNDARGGPPGDLVLHQSSGDWAAVTDYHFDQTGAETLLKSAFAYDFSPPKVFLPAVANIGETFSSSGSCGNVGGYNCTYTSKGTIESFEVASVPAGDFDAMKIRYDEKLTLKEGQLSFSWNITDTIWLGLGIGQVKRVIVTVNSDVPEDVQTEEIELLSTNLTGANDGKQEEDDDCEKHHGDPINVTTGNSHQRAIDYPLLSGLDFERRYNSIRAPFRSPVGFGWRHNYDLKLSFLSSVSPRRVTIFREDGRVLGFTEPALGSLGPWLTDSDSRDRLVAEYNGSSEPYRWRYYPGCAKIISFGSEGPPLEIQEASGRAKKYVYEAFGDGRFSGVRDSISGRKLSIVIDKEKNQLDRIRDEAGFGVSFSYVDVTGDLKSVGVTGESAVVYAYNEPQRTGGANLPHTLTTLKGEDGKVYAKWTFDAQRRATSSALGSVGVVHRVSYDAPGVSTLSYPNGKSGQVQYTSIQNVPVVTSRELPRIDSMAGGAVARLFDANRNVRQRDDFNGNRTCSKYSLSRNVETVRVEGLASTVDCESVLGVNATLPKGSRKVSTDWHPDWRFRARVAEPLKITTYVYNGEMDPLMQKKASCVTPATARLGDGKVLGVLCALIEQRTDDDLGAMGFDAVVKSPARTWRYEYNGSGQLTSMLDPVKNKTSYEYYTEASYPDGKSGRSVGDLKTVTNGAGHQTLYDLYDKAGRLLQMTDANETKTELGYEAHGWLETVKVTPADGGGVPQLTRYDYYPTGLLKTVTTPDGMAVSMLYDDARRLTAVTDSAGNTVHYIPDEMGNVGVEELRSKNGQLARRVERIFNDLNRLKDLKVVVQ